MYGKNVFGRHNLIVGAYNEIANWNETTQNEHVIKVQT